MFMKALYLEYQSEAAIQSSIASSGIEHVSVLLNPSYHKKLKLMRILVCHRPLLHVILLLKIKNKRRICPSYVLYETSQTVLWYIIILLCAVY